MHPQMKKITCALMRGGTSKGVFIPEDQLPKDPARRDRVIRAVFGSPDVRQIDGLGGADVLTSKLAIIGPPSHPDADVDYTFGQVSIDSEIIDYQGNCGNISSAVGAYAVDEGLVAVVEPFTSVRIHMTNSGRILRAKVPVAGGKAAVAGDYAIDGVPGTGARIDLDWSDTCGGLTGKLLPTGRARETIEVEGQAYPVSLVDAGNPVVFIQAESLGLQGPEPPAWIEGQAGLMKRIEQIRGIAALRFGLVDHPEEAAVKSPYIPFFAIVSPPAAYETLNGGRVEAADSDLVVRLLFMLKMHKAYPITGAICTGAASCIQGSIVNLTRRAYQGAPLRLGHPSGIIEVDALGAGDEKQVKIERLSTSRTARRIMDGGVYVRNCLFDD